MAFVRNLKWHMITDQIKLHFASFECYFEFRDSHDVSKYTTQHINNCDCVCVHTQLRACFYTLWCRYVNLCVCYSPEQEQDSACLLTCSTIYLSSLIWFDSIPWATVSANSSQCDAVVWHKVMKTHKALITCQWLWGWAVVDQYAHRHTDEEHALSHTLQAYTHTGEPAACCCLNYPAVIGLWLIVPFFMAAIW